MLYIMILLSFLKLDYKGDKLLAKTVTMGYDFGDLKSHVSEMYRPSGKVRFFFDVLVFFTMILSFYTSTYLFAFVPETLNVSESFILYWAEVIYILDAIHLSIVVYTVGINRHRIIQ